MRSPESLFCRAVAVGHAVHYIYASTGSEKEGAKVSDLLVLLLFNNKEHNLEQFICLFRPPATVE